MSSLTIDHQDEAEYQQLVAYMPTDLLKLIITYVPFVEFTWTNPAVIKKSYWNKQGWGTDVKWNGRFTTGIWTSSGIQAHYKEHVMEAWSDGHDPKVEMRKLGHGMLPSMNLARVIQIFKGRSNRDERIIVTLDKLLMALDAYFSKQAFRYRNVPFNEKYTYIIPTNTTYHCFIVVIKVPYQEFINELQFIYDTVVKHPFYNNKVKWKDQETHANMPT